MDDIVKIVCYIKRKTGFGLNEYGKTHLKELLKKYSYTLLEECIDKSFLQYFHSDENNPKVASDSFEDFFDKIGGIAHNLS